MQQQHHPFRPPVQPPPSSRSTETPMDFTYDKASASASYLSASDPRKATIRPLKVLDQNGNHHHANGASQSSSQSDVHLRNNNNNSSSKNKSTSWFASFRSCPEPPRKRLHCETESMDWETCLPDPKPNLFPNPDSTRAPAGGTFLFHTPKELSLPQPPTFTAPSALSSPQKIGPEAYGLHLRSHSVYREDQEADSSLDMDQVVLPKMYSNNAVKHESRRRTRAQKKLRSKLSSLSFDSENDDEDSDVEVVPGQQEGVLAARPNKSSRKRLDRTKSDPVGVTITGWKSGADAGPQQNPSRLSTDTPYILLVYLQLLFNSSLVFVGLYLAINLILIIRTDINHKFLVHTTRLRQEIELCTKEYHSNRCYPVEQRTQFIEKHCIEWEACMSRNPNLISRSKIGAETFAEVMNGFVDVISWKTMLFIFLSIGAGIYATNLAMNNYKSKWDPHHHHQGPPYYYPKSRSSPSSWAPRLTSRSEGSSKDIDNQPLDPMTIFGSSQKK
ncbi:hypothetical protein PCANC_23275 [Puccinia coronata f. sp. avenae]|uniref:Brl1/Brr6 domain-containing protein n=1 Tax=Puccinia coronata f. sp. avenae TaxID=200324 RepID=A0A2N5TY64_9BASI|nr:hypothetical protein PCANC_23275 [Puccinia coronata f. sp. avenae]